eukprot:2706992-Rhodomonas_salina.1
MPCGTDDVRYSPRLCGQACATRCPVLTSAIWLPVLTSAIWLSGIIGAGSASKAKTPTATAAPVAAPAAAKEEAKTAGGGGGKTGGGGGLFGDDDDDVPAPKPKAKPKSSAGMRFLVWCLGPKLRFGMLVGFVRTRSCLLGAPMDLT